MTQHTGSPAEGERRLYHRLASAAGSLVVLAVFVAAVYVLHRELRAYHLSDVERSLSRLAWRNLLAALALTASSYSLLTGYDWLALDYIRFALPYPRIALASFISYVSSYNFGAILGGTTMRYRLYSAAGLSAVEIVKVIAICTLTFVLGFCLLAGAVFYLDPLPMPDFVTLPLATTEPIGLALLTGVALYLGLSILRRRPITIRGWEFALPGFRFTLTQLAVASTDLVCAAGVLYMLLPGELAVAFPRFLGIFLLAQVAGIASHVPGGLGVVEAVLLLMLAPRDPAALLGSLLAYRLVYYLVPLGLAAILLAGHEAFHQREAVSRFANLFGQWAPSVAPRVLAFTVFAGGALLVFSGALPRSAGRWEGTPELVPWPLVEVAHLLGTLAGMGLLLVARGLQQRLSAAYRYSVLLLAGGIVCALVKSFDYQEAIVLAVMLATLLPCRGYFTRRASLAHETFTPGWMTSIFLVLAGSVWLGLFSFKHVDYQGALWWQFALEHDAPRFLRATAAAAALLVAAGWWRFRQPAAPHARLPNAAELAAAEAIVRRSPQARAGLALAGDKPLLFGADRSAFIMYGVRGQSWVALGDPVGPPREATELAWQFRELCDEHSGWTVFYQVGEQYLSLYVDLGLALLKLGDQGRVALASFSLEGPSRQALRDTRAAAQRARCTFEVVPPPAGGTLLAELREVSDQWLSAQGGREQRFSHGFFDDLYLRAAPLAVVRQDDRIVAFANVLCGAAKQELAVDLLRYRPAAPAGVTDFLLIEMALWGQAAGYDWFNLGLAPAADLESGPLAPLWQRLGTQLFGHNEHGDTLPLLRAAQARFAPHWSPVYLASPAGLHLPHVLADVAGLIAGR